MKLRALIPVAGLALLPLAACHGTNSTAPSGPVLTSPPVTAPVTAPPKTPMTTHAPPARVHKHVQVPVRKTTPEPTVAAQCSFRYQAGEPLPDPKCTPGAVLTTSTADVCSKGWASSHREYFTKAQREAAFARYGVYTSDPAAYGEYDHLIPLELGGSNSTLNLWPEKGKIPNAKDAVEDALHSAVCSGKISLTTAQHEIATDWVTVPDNFQTS